MIKRILLKSMETEFKFRNSRSSINCLMLSVQDRQDLKAITEDLGIMDLDLKDLMALDMVKEEVEMVAHTNLNGTIVRK